MYLKCTRLSRIPENDVTLLSQIVPFRRIANIVGKKKHHFSNVTGNSCASRIPPKTVAYQRIYPLTKKQAKNAHFEAWLKLSKLKISFYYIFTLHRKWGNLWKLNAIIMWSFDRRCFFLDMFHHFIGVFLDLLYEK